MAATFKTLYGAVADLTITLASLATSATRVAGRQSTAVTEASDLALDELVSGKITVGTTPTINTYIDIWVFAQQDDAPTYPTLVTTGLGASDAAATAATEGIRNNAMKWAASILVDATTSDRVYSFAAFSVAQLFGGRLPKRWGVFVAHNTGVNLNATGTNHQITRTPIFEQSV